VRVPASTDRVRVVLVHGAATTARVWRHVVRELSDFDVVCPDRRCTGDLDAEVGALAPLCENAIVAGVSGGATLGLAMAARGVPFRAALLHEPATGSLLPGLLDAVVAAYASGGVDGFGAALYGTAWTPAEAGDHAAVGRDIAMFRAFEPTAPAPPAGPVVVSVGALSPARRHASVDALRGAFGFDVVELEQCAHAAHLEAPRIFADAVRRLVEPQ
jgi:pimeloyl-ACP methyl ester carboxylesterase